MWSTNKFHLKSKVSFRSYFILGQQKLISNWKRIKNMLKNSLTWLRNYYKVINQNLFKFVRICYEKKSNMVHESIWKSARKYKHLDFFVWNRGNIVRKRDDLGRKWWEFQIKTAKFHTRTTNIPECLHFHVKKRTKECFDCLRQRKKKKMRRCS